MGSKIECCILLVKKKKKKKSKGTIEKSDQQSLRFEVNFISNKKYKWSKHSNEQGETVKLEKIVRAKYMLYIDFQFKYKYRGKVKWRI